MASLTKVKLNNIDTSVTFVYDPLVLLNFGATQANTDIGFVFNRDGGISSNVALYWNETLDRIVVGYTNATGLPNSNIALSRYANVAADWYYGNLAGGTTNTVFVSANVLPTANAFYNFGSPTARWNVGYFAATTLDLGGSQISVDPTNGFKFTVGGTGTPIYLASNGAVNGTTLSSATTLTVGTSAAIGTNLTAGGFINATGNVIAAGGIFNALTVNGNESVTGFLNVTGNILGAGAVLNSLNVNGITSTTNYINTSANVMAAQGSFGSINSTGFINTAGNISASQGQFATINTSGLINSTANISASMFSGGQIFVSGLVNAGGNVLARSGIFNFVDVNGNIIVGDVGVPGVGHSIVGNVTQSGAGTIFYNTPGNIMALQGFFGSINSTGFINTSGNVSAAVHLGGQVAVSGLINTAGNVLAATLSGGSVSVTGLINTAGNIIAPSLTTFGNTNIGALTTPDITHLIVGNIRQSGAGTVFFNTTGNISAAVGVFGAINSTGYINTSGNISTPQLNTALVNSTGNVLASGGVFSSLAVNGGITSTGFINTSGNVSGAVGLFGSINSTGFVNTSGNVSTAQLNAGQINTTGNVLATGGVFNLFRVNHQLGGGNSSSFNDSVTTATSSNQTLKVNGGNQYVFFNANLGAGSYNPIVTSNDIGAIFSGFAGQGTGNLVIAPWSVSQAGIRIVGTTGLVQIPGQLTINANNSPTAIALGGTSGVGNIGVSGTPFNTAFLTTLNATGNVLAAAGTFNALTVNGTLNTTGNILGAGGVLNSLTVNGNETVTGFLNVSGNILGAGGVLNSLTVNGNQSVTGFLNVTGNILALTADVAGIEATGIVYANSTAVTTTSTSGAVRIAGGTGIGGNTVIAGILTAGRTTGVNVANFTDTVGAFYGTANSWVQLSIQNASTAVGASTDFIAYANNGDNNTGWIDMGITGQNYVNQNGQYAITGPNDGYVFMSAPTGTTGGGNLVIATGDTGVYNDVVIATGGFDTIHEQARFIDGVGLRLQQGTASINPSTGALIVQGGVGIGGNLNVQGDISLNGNLILTGNAITFNTNNLSISDSLIYLADGNSADVLDIGFIGAFTNPGYQHTGFVRDATDGTWKIFANVVAEPVTTVDFTNATYSNLKIGNLSAVSAGFDSNVTAAYYIGTLGTAAQPLVTSLGTLTSLTASGLINTSGNVLAAGGVFNALTVNGNESVTGFLNVTGNILASQARLNYLDVNGNVDLGLAGAISGSWHTFIGNITQTSSGGAVYVNTTGNVLAAVGQFGSVNSTGFINTSGNISTAQLNAGQINTTGNILAQGAVFNSERVNGTSTVNILNSTGNILGTGGIFSSLTVNGGITSTGFFNTSGNISGAVGLFGSITSTGFINTSGNVSAAQVNAGPIVATGNVTVGNLIVPAGSGRFSGTFDENSTTSGVFAGNTGTGTPSPRLGLFNGVAAQNWQIDNYFGTLRWFTPGLTRMELNSSGNLAVNGLTTIAPGSTNLDSAFTISGNVFRGGVGYHDFMRVTSTFSGVSNGNKFFRLDSVGSLEIVNSAYTAIPFRLTDGGLLSISGNINAGSLSTPGAQHTFAGNLIINGFGAIQVPAGTTTQRPSSTTAGQIRFNTDTNQFEGYGNAWAAIGGGGGGGGTPGGVSSTVQYNNGGVFAGAVNLNYIVANGAVIVSSGTSSTSTSTGALQVIGGIGVTENINAGGSITATGLINTAANVSASQVSAASVVTTGAVNAGGNVLARVGIFNELDVNGNIFVGLISTPGAGHSIVGNVTQSGAGTIFYNTPGNIMALQGSFGSINSTGLINTTGNLLAASGVLNALTVNGSITSTGFINTSGNVSGAGVNTGTLNVTGATTLVQVNSTGFINTNGNVSAAIGSFGAINSTGFINTSGNISGAGVNTGTLTATGATTLVQVNSTGFINTTGNLSAAIVTAATVTATGTITAGFFNTAGNIAVNGGIFNTIAVNGTVGTSLNPTTSNSFSIGSSTNWWSNFWGRAVNAAYADLAETYSSDREYIPGTVLIFGGDKEVTVSTESHDTRVAGVVSTNPAYHMNAAAEGVAVALQGRVPTKVKGPVKKGDRVVTSDIQGAAERLDMSKYQPGCIIGKALEDIADDSIQTIEVVVGRV